MSKVAPHTVLHYTSADDDRGGVMSVVRALASAGRFNSVLGVNAGFTQRRTPPLATLELPKMDGEVISPFTVWRARAVAREVQAWLRTDAKRIFHGHSRVGLLVALWLERWGERRVVMSVHCFGRQRWFYRWAARRLAGRLYWLSPAMKRHYAVGEASWAQCIPSCLPAGPASKEARVRESSALLRLGGIGSLVAWKGWHLVIDALAKLPASVRARTTFRHIGSPGKAVEQQRYAEALRATTISRGLADSVLWLGEQPSSAALLAEIDCLVVPSDHEPFSMATLEALAAGVPVLAADSGGPVDLLSPGKDGWFFRTGDAADLARAIMALVETDALACAQVPADAVRQFTAPVVTARWAEVYAAL